MESFVVHKDALGQLLQQKSEALFLLMQQIELPNLGLSEHGEIYFATSHLKRLFFSIQTSAHILYNSISITQKNVEDIVLMDYGAGIGSLYLLAKLIGCKKVIYNDHLEDWKNNALLIAHAIGVDVDEYIVGGIETTLDNLKHKNIVCDIIATRNVIEHIYQLSTYYKAIHESQPTAIIYNSTTANFHNPAMNLQHVLLHQKWGKMYENMRKTMIKSQAPQLTAQIIQLLAQKTRGYNTTDLTLAVNNYVTKGVLPPKGYFYTNSCEPQYGVWAENILPISFHKRFITDNGMDAFCSPGFWDTHYDSPLKNSLGSLLNKLIALNSRLGFVLAPFIYVVALPKNTK